MSDVKQNISEPRRAYEKPRMQRVRLAEDESVLRACKTAVGGGNGPLGHCRQPDKCYTYGS